jgi:hypothetical protein
LVLFAPPPPGRGLGLGVVLCPLHSHHASIRADLPALTPHHVLRKWLYIDSTHRNFESTVESVARRIARNDPRFGVVPGSATRRRNQKRR